MCKVLVIGGYGFIGSHFCKLLQSKCISFDIVDLNIPTGNPDALVIHHRRKGLPRQHTLEWARHNFYDTVVHFGSIAGVRGNLTAQEYWDNNNTCLQKYLTKLNYKKFVYISSSSVLGNVKSPYSISKDVAEAQVAAIAKDFVIVRPFTVYGENGRPDMLIQRLLDNEEVFINGDPTSIKRRFTYVGDLVNEIFLLATRFTAHKYCNMIGEEVTMQEIINIVQKYRNGLPKLKYTDADKRDFTEYSFLKKKGINVELRTTFEEYIKKLRYIS